MSWQTALRKTTARLHVNSFARPQFRTKDVDWDRLVSLDLETYYDADYTLSKLSTSEYVRDKRFKAQMMGMKIGRGPTKIYGPKQIAAALRKVNWATHSLLCHHAQFDGLILSHHYGVVPSFYYDTLSMARGLHSNEIGAGLEEVSLYYGGQGKLKDILETTKGVLDWPKALFDKTAPYCANDTDEMYRVFQEMHLSMPTHEMDLIDVIVRMFCDPVLKVNVPRAQIELAREIKERDELLATVVDLAPYKADQLTYKKILPKTAERNLPLLEHDQLMVRRIIGSNERFAELLRLEDVEPPQKLSKAWMKLDKEQREERIAEKWTYAFAKDDLDFANLPDQEEHWLDEYDLDNPEHVKMKAAKSIRLRTLVDARIAVKSTTNITRAERLISAGSNGWSLPAYYAYSRAHTHRLGGGDKRNLQNLKRGGELRQCIEAPPGYVLVVGDSGQIEARVNAKLWGQNDLLEAFRAADEGTGLDPYCLMGTTIYGRAITKADKMERFVGKVLTLALGFQMGAAKLQMTLAKGALGGPPVFITLKEAQRWINLYRAKNRFIVKGWDICKGIIEDMAAGRTGSHGPICWEANKVWLPNGLCLHYPDLRKIINDKGWDEWTYASGDIRKKIYAGLLCENIVQALARIIVMYQLLELSRKERLVMTTHDEGVLCVKKRSADAAFQRMMKTMTTPPDWWPDIPLAAEGGHAENYSK